LSVFARKDGTWYEEGSRFNTDRQDQCLEKSESCMDATAWRFLLYHTLYCQEKKRVPFFNRMASQVPSYRYYVCYSCQWIISIQKFKLLDEVPEYDLYYSLTHPLKWKLFGLETWACLFYLVLNFYQINEDGEIRTRDRLVIKTLIPC
jgi:hypothetical protein